MRSAILTSIVALVYVASVTGDVGRLYPFDKLHPGSQIRDAPLNLSNPNFAAEDPPPPPLEPPADDDVWEKCRSKGCNLVAAMRLSDHEAAQQLFDPPENTIQSDLIYDEDYEDWGWEEFLLEQGPIVDFYRGQPHPRHGWGVGHVLTALGLSDKIEAQGGKMVVHYVVHGDPNQASFDNQKYRVNGRDLRVTGADLKFAFNLDEGVIIAMDVTSPSAAAKERTPPVPDDQLPLLKRFSDIAYLFWLSYNDDKPPRNLRYFMSLTITNDETESIIHRALNNVGQTLGPWPGVTFNWDTDEFKAILGSPNGNGFAYFLIQHKFQLDNMFIDKVYVFHGDTYHQAACLVFHVLSQPPPEATPEPSSSSLAAPVRRASAISLWNRGGRSNTITSHYALRTSMGMPGIMILA